MKELRHLPVTFPPLELAELESFFTTLANRLLDRLRPQEQES
ncbi:MAG: hypothetical protein ACUVV0_15460 [Anaerolineae bacterium]